MPWVAALGIAVPAALLLPRSLDTGTWWMALAVAALVAAVFYGAALVARRLGASAIGFSAVFVILVALGLARAEHYALAEGLTDLALVYLVFYAAALAARAHRLLGRFVLCVAVLALAAAAILRTAHLQIFGAELDAEGYRALMQSNVGEIGEFLGRFVSIPLAAGALAAAAISVAAAWLAAPPRLPGRALAAGAVGVLVAGALLFAHRPLVGERLEGYAAAFDFLHELAEYRALSAARSAQAAGPPVARRAPLADAPQTYVFIVGESLSRNHMSLYGYWRETTPRLAALAGELAVFRDVVSPHPHTDPALERALTLMDNDNRLAFTDPANYTLVELLRGAGFTTWWISNQNTFGAWDNKTAVIAKGAHHLLFTNKNTGRFVAGDYDEVLLAPFAAALADPAPRKAIFLHFLGNHWEYWRRYPQDIAPFSKPHDAREVGAHHEIQTKRHAVVQYDNSVWYHDLLVARIIEELRAAARPAALVLFSDHGENLFEAKSHHWKYFTRDHVEIPLLIWFSPEYRALAPAMVRRAQDAARLPFALDHLPDLVADLAHLDSPLFEAARSPLSPQYRAPRTRSIYSGYRLYEDENEALLNVHRALAQMGGLRSRVWAHRVNTLGKMMDAARLFPGVEIDVVFDPASGLMVNHPPQPFSGLKLEDQLAYANRLAPGLALWLDLKNLTEANAPAIVGELKRLDSRHAIRGRAIVETGHTGPSAAQLRAAGFQTSYYLVPKGSDCAAAAELERVLAARRFAAVSYDYAGHGWVERCLGATIKKLGLKTYTWDLERALSDYRYPGVDDERRRSYARMAAVLLPFRSLFDDWR